MYACYWKTISVGPDTCFIIIRTTAGKERVHNGTQCIMLIFNSASFKEQYSLETTLINIAFEPTEDIEANKYNLTIKCILSICFTVWVELHYSFSFSYVLDIGYQSISSFNAL